MNMRALIRTGNPKTIQLDSDHPRPEYPTDAGHCYIIQTKATALTRGELTWPEPLTQRIPIPGYDLAGVVVAGPNDVHPRVGSKFKPGDKIYAMTSFHHQGNAREYTEAYENEMALMPDQLTWAQAASVPLSALSAWQALFVHGRLSTDPLISPVYEEKRVLVTAASGGVGIWGVQLAHCAGATVVGTCGFSNVDFVKGLGADTVLDYNKTNILEWVNEDRENRSFDIILDCIGGQTLVEAWQCVRKGGKVISVAEPPEPKRPTEGVPKGVEGAWFIVAENGGQLDEISKLIHMGKCKPVVDSEYRLDDFEEAFQRLDEGHARGKIVLTLE